MENALLNLFNQNLANKATDIYNQRQRDLVNQAAMDVFSTGFNNRNTGIMSQASGIPLPEFDMANLPMYETDDEQVEFLQGQKEPSGIAKLFELFQKFSPTANIMKGIQSIRNRFDTRSAIRDDIQRDTQGTINQITSPRIMNMTPTNEIDRDRGDRPGGANYSAPSKPQRSFSSDYSEAQRARKF